MKYIVKRLARKENSPSIPAKMLNALRQDGFDRILERVSEYIDGLKTKKGTTIK